MVTLIENTPGAPGCLFEHGLSFYAETKNHKILADTGASGAFLKNAQTLGIDLRQVDTVVISHGHYDHGGGLLEFAALNPTAKIYLSKIDFTTPLSIIVPYIFFNIINIIGPNKSPKTPINLNPVYIAIKVKIGCIPILPLTILGSINCLIILIIHHRAKIPIANFKSPVKAKNPDHGSITVPDPNIGNASTKAIPNAINSGNSIFHPKK